MTGVPPDHAYRLIDLDPNSSISDLKKQIQREYQINPILNIQLIFKGRILPDQLRFAKLGINFERDIITVMLTQGGGAR